MFIYQDGKLHIQKGEMLVGVEIYSDKVLTVGEEIPIGNEFQVFTPFEVMCKFQINEDNPYIYPKEEVVDNVADTNGETGKTKTTSRKPRSK